jgi:hypothetical protein
MQKAGRNSFSSTIGIEREGTTVEKGFNLLKKWLKCKLFTINIVKMWCLISFSQIYFVTLPTNLKL